MYSPGAYTSNLPKEESLAQRRRRWRQEAFGIYNILWFWQKWMVDGGGHYFVRQEPLISEGGPTALYLFICPDCKIPDMDYHHGHEKRLECSACCAQTAAPAATSLVEAGSV